MKSLARWRPHISLVHLPQTLILAVRPAHDNDSVDGSSTLGQRLLPIRQPRAKQSRPRLNRADADNFR